MSTEEVASDVPQSAAEVILATIDIVDMLAKFAIEVFNNADFTFDNTDNTVAEEQRQQVIQWLEEQEMQEDLRTIANWFEKRPHSNHDAWRTTHAAEYTYHTRSEEEE